MAYFVEPGSFLPRVFAWFTQCWKLLFVFFRRTDSPRTFMFCTAPAWAADWWPGSPLAYLLDAVAARVGVEATTREFDDPMIRLLSLWLKS